jgi:antitoxin component YwqK of YwqJK toxin-antitoxin module
MRKTIFSLGLLLSVASPVFSQKNAVNKNFFQDFIKAVELMDDEKLEDAQDLLEDIPEQDSLYLKAQFRLQLLYNQSENFPKVAEVGARLSQLPFSGGHQVYNYWALALSKMEKYEEALEVTLSGLASYSESHLLHYRHGMVLQELKREQEAMYAYQRAVLAYPLHVFSHIKLGEIAAHEGRQTQALMSLVFATLLDDTPGIKAALHATLEKVAMLDFEAEEKNIKFDEGDDFSEIDKLIQSKLALSTKFKLKSKLKMIGYTRQLQVICETIKFDEQVDGFWMQHYAKFYQDVYKFNFFDGLTYASLVGPDYGKLNAAAFKNDKKRDAFVNWFAQNFNIYVARQYLNFEGKKQVVYVELGDQNIVGRGLGDSYNERSGAWKLFDGFNGRPVGTGPFKNGERDGEWIIYDEITGLLSRRLIFSQGNLNGLFMSYYPNGQTEVRVNLKDDLREGQRIIYFPSGDTSIIDHHVKGERTGLFTQYHPNNAVRITGKLINDKWDGEVLEYHTNGALNSKLKYKEDKREGAFTFFHINGKLSQKGTFKEDLLVDDFEAYHNNGQLEARGRYKNGTQIGKWVRYYYDGKLEEELEFDENGKKNAVQKMYDRDGKIHYEMDYKNGELQAYKFYDKTGKIVDQEKRSGKKFKYK